MLTGSKLQQVMHSREVFEISVTEEKYEAAISSIVAQGCFNPQDGQHPMVCSNPQDGDSDFNLDDDVYKAAISDLSLCYDEDRF